MQYGHNASVKSLSQFSCVDVKNPVPLGGEPFVPHAISLQPFWREVMLAINFDYEAMFVNNKISNVVPDGSLPADMDTVESAKFLQVRPQTAFAVCHAAPQFAGTRDR